MSQFLTKTKGIFAIGRGRGLATISFRTSGAPAEVLRSAPSTSSADAVSVGSVRVAIKASAVQVEDVRSIRGLSSFARNGDVAGSVGSGVVTGLATGEGEFSSNDNVLVVGEGVWSDEVVVSKNSVIKVAGLTHEELAVLPAFAAAWGLLHNFVALKAGDVVVQTYGSSAIGSAVTQLGKALGLKVVSLADSDVKGTNVAAKLQEAGAFKLALSGKSGKHLSSLQRHVAKGGTTVVYNGVFEPLQSVADVQLPISHMIFSDSSVHGFDLQAWARAAPGEFKAAVSSLTALAADKKIALKAAQTFPQAEYLKAIEEVTQTGAAVVLKH